MSSKSCNIKYRYELKMNCTIQGQIGHKSVSQRAVRLQVAPGRLRVEHNSYDNCVQFSNPDCFLAMIYILE